MKALNKNMKPQWSLESTCIFLYYNQKANDCLEEVKNTSGEIDKRRTKEARRGENNKDTSPYRRKEEPGGKISDFFLDA